MNAAARLDVTDELALDAIEVIAHWSRSVICFLSRERPRLTRNAFFKDGKYSLLARPGEKRVEIRASRVSVPAITGELRESEKREDIIPPRYNSESQLTVAVEPNNDNRFDFHLSGDHMNQPLRTIYGGSR